MKSRFIFPLGLFWFHCFSVALSKDCTEAAFKRGIEVINGIKYKEEWGYGIRYLLKMLFGRSSKTDLEDLSSDTIKNLCACAIWKRNQAYSDTYTRQDYKKILDETFAWEYGTCVLTLRYYGIPYDATVKSVLCSSGEKGNMKAIDRVIITNGIEKKSGNQSSYNIYVARVNSDGRFVDFQGVINDLSV